MTTTLTIQNSDKMLIEALTSVIRLHPQAKVTVQSRGGDGFYDEENIRHLEEQVRRINEGKAILVTKTLDELEALAR